MKLLKYSTIILIVLFLTSCNREKKSTVAPTTVTPVNPYAYLGTLSPSQEVVKNELIAYLTYLKSFNTNEIVKKTYTPLFSVINETHFREYISTMMHSKDIIIKKYDTNITKIGKVKAFSNGTQFSQISYTSNAKIIFLNDKLYNNATSINFLYDVFIHKYGKENIHVDIAKRSLEIKRKEKMIVIKEENQPWKFIGDTLEYRRLYPNILPYEILTNLEN